MNQTKKTKPPARLLRDSAGLRSAAYLGTMVGVLLTSFRLPRNPEHPFLDNVHPYAFPAVFLITDAFKRLTPEEYTAPLSNPTRRDLEDLATGMALGAGACLSVLGVAAAQGWISAPEWGWAKGADRIQVFAAAGWTAANIGLLVYNEEQIFRGYGLDALTEALGEPLAVAVSTALFARYHGPGLERLLGLSGAGLFLSFLRLGTGNLWLASGFHFAWNVMQKSMFGPADGPLSIRPLRLHGPAEWIGRPGHPDPGRLQILFNVLLAAIGGVWLRRIRTNEAFRDHSR